MKKTMKYFMGVLLIATILSHAASAVFSFDTILLEGLSLDKNMLSISEESFSSEVSFEEIIELVNSKDDSLEQNEINNRALLLTKLHFEKMVASVMDLWTGSEIGLDRMATSALEVQKAITEDYAEEIVEKQVKQKKAVVESNVKKEAAPNASQNQSEVEAWKQGEYLGTFSITAYCPYEDSWGSMTATGVRAKEGVTIAVDPKVIPYGTKIYIEGVGIRVAQDCGGLVKGNKIDLYFETIEAMNNWGLQKRDIWIVE